MEIKNIKFEEGTYNKRFAETTLFFTAPKYVIDEIFPGRYPEAKSCTIQIMFQGDVAAYNAAVSISPTNFDEEEDAWVDYDWQPIDGVILTEEIEALMHKAEGHKLDEY